MQNSSNKIVLALDAMGGDNAPDIVLEGAHIALKKHPNVEFILYGDKSKIESKLFSYPSLAKVSSIKHTSTAIAPDEKPSIALRRGKNSSMRLAVDAVKEKSVNAAISAGNTGALMAMSKLSLRTIPGIDRPAITSLFPTRKGECVLLDLGANIDCNSDNLVQFAIMGDAFAKVLLKKNDPKIGLLNVGSEETKGSEIVRAAAEELKEANYSVNFYGYVEGDDIAAGTVDVVVTDGFTGNVALKTAEGTAKICADYIKQAFRSSPFALLGGLLAKRAMKKMFKCMDPRYHNGAMFLGLNGIVVKSHGGTDGVGYANAIRVAINLAENNINESIAEELASFEEDILDGEEEDFEQDY